MPSNIPPDIIEPNKLEEINPDRSSSGKHFNEGVIDVVPILLGYIPIAIAFGVLAKTSGLSVLEAALMSGLLYAGSAQFITISLIATGASLPAIIFTTFLVNIRHVLYSAALAPHLRKIPLWKNILIGSELTDETFAVSTNKLTKGRSANPSWMFGINIPAHSTWIIVTILGGLLSGLLPDTKALGIDYALIGMFAALLILQISNNKNVRMAIIVGITGAILAILGQFVIAPSWAVVLSTIIAATVGLMFEKS